MQADRGLQIGAIQRLAERAAEFAIQTNIDLRVREAGDVGDMRAERKGHADFGAWRIILVDSCVPGQAGGHVSEAQLQSLQQSLAGCERYAMICVHHHPVHMASRWLDAVGIDNADAFFRVLDAHPQVRAINWGHVHQCFDARRHGVRLLATPSTCMQFLPLSDAFAVDARQPAYRRIALREDGTLETEVVWVQQAAPRIETAASRAR